MDILEVNGLHVTTTIGVHAWEKQIKQKLLLDLKLHTSFEDCNDTLTNTIDYASLCKTVTDLLESTTFDLIETVAEKVAIHINSEFNPSEIAIRVCKPHAIKNAASVCVSIQR